MANGLTIEQLKFAREIGAAVHNESSNTFKKYDEDGIKYAYVDGCWRMADPKGLPVSGDAEIDFSPLDDYYADKELDIAATGGEIPPPQYDPKDVAFRAAPCVKMSDKYPAYFKDFSGDDEADVYLVHHKFCIDDPSGCIHHASKKLLLSGVRTGGKSKYQDVKEARDTLNRWLEINKDLAE